MINLRRSLRTVVISILAITALAYAPLALAASWSTAVDVSAAGGSASMQQISSSADGSRLAAVWSRFDGSAFVIQAATATVANGTATWSSPQTLSAAGQSAFDPQIATSSDGTRLAAIWQRWDGSRYIIQASTATVTNNTAAWSTISNLSANTDSSRAPQIASSSDGTQLGAVWARQNGTYLVQSATATVANGIATWSSPYDMSVTDGSVITPQITMSADGSRMASAWSLFNGVQYLQVRTATVSHGTATWRAVGNVVSTGNPTTPQLASSVDGTRLALTWKSDGGPGNVIQAATATVSGNLATWSTIADLSDASQNAETPQIAMSSDGSTIATVWRWGTSSPRTIQTATATVSSNVATWSTPANLSAAGGDALNPQIVSSSDGTRIAAIWRRSNGSNPIAQAATAVVVDGIATWSSTTDLSAAGQDASGPAITSSSDGSLLAAAWDRNNGSDTIVQVSTLYDPAATASNDPTATWAEFTFWLPDGRECGAISPVRVRVGSVYTLPEADADCCPSRSDEIHGWTIPVAPDFTGAGSTSLPFAPGRAVYVVDSQQFTAHTRK